MAAIFNSPSKYIQGPDELAKLGSYVEPLGAKALVIVTPSGKKRVGAKIEGGFAEAKAELLFEDFNGECSKGEVGRLVALARDNGCDIIVGVGGGKILDTAKAVAYYLGSPVIICPTIASTDAPCSALSVLYTDDGQFDKYLFLKANPNIVLMDTTVIAASPVRLTVSPCFRRTMIWDSVFSTLGRVRRFTSTFGVTVSSTASNCVCRPPSCWGTLGS